MSGILQEAINDPAGILAEYWLHGLSLWRATQEPKPKKMDETYRAALSELVNDSSYPGALARSVIASQFVFLLAVDSEWTIEYLRPLFLHERGARDFQAAWDGFLIWGRLTPTVAEQLNEALYIGIQHIQDELAESADRFIEFYTAFLVHYADDVQKKWIPALFSYANEHARHHFAWSIERHLRQMEAKSQTELWQRWLHEYWENRVQGVPAPLSSREVEAMLGWLPHMPSEFTDGVQVAIRMPPGRVEHRLPFHELYQSQVSDRYPIATVDLVLYFDKLEIPGYAWHRAPELINKLIASGLPLASERKLRELAARRGISPDS